MADKDALLKARLEDWFLGLHPLWRIAVGILPAILLVIILEALWVQPRSQDLHLLSVQQHTQQLRLDRLRREVQKNAELKALAQKTRKGLLEALSSFQDQDPNTSLEALDRVLSQAGIVITEEPLVEPPPAHESPITLKRVSSSIETSYPGLTWALSVIALKGPLFSMEELTLEPFQTPKPGELVKEITLRGKISLIQVITHPDLVQDFPGGFL